MKVIRLKESDIAKLVDTIVADHHKFRSLMFIAHCSDTDDFRFGFAGNDEKMGMIGRLEYMKHHLVLHDEVPK